MKRGLCARRALVAVTVMIAATVILALGCASRRQPQGDPTPQGPAGASWTIQDGIYTEEQRLRGEVVYFTTCVLCHKPELTGTEIIPTLIGEKFLARWTRRSVGDLFELMRTSMPPLVTQRRTPQEYADVLAYLLNRNEFPAGPEELSSEFADLTGIRMAPGESN
ncbi:MAG: cytochrome c [Acidobacteriota bacterium]